MKRTISTHTCLPPFYFNAYLPLINKIPDEKTVGYLAVLFILFRYFIARVRFFRSLIRFRNLFFSFFLHFFLSLRRA